MFAGSIAACQTAEEASLSDGSAHYTPLKELPKITQARVHSGDPTHVGPLALSDLFFTGFGAFFCCWAISTAFSDPP